MASAHLRRLLAVMHTKIYLIQEPYYFKGIQGLDLNWGFVHSVNDGSKCRACVYTRKDVNAMKLQQFCNGDMAVVLVSIRRGQETFKFICCSLYLPYDGSVEPLVLSQLLEYCKSSKIPILIGCDANAHHIFWGSSDTNERGIALMDLISGNNLFVLNRNNRPTFCNAVREEVIDLTLCSGDLIPEVTNWEVWEEESLSDHRYIRFEIGCKETLPVFHRNIRNTNWDVYREKVRISLESWYIPSNNSRGLDSASQSLSDIIVQAYEDSCPLQLVNFDPKRQPLSRKLENLSKVSRRAWNRRRRFPEAYRAALRKYKTEVRKQERQSFRSFCGDVSSERELSRMNKIFSKSGDFQAGSIRNSHGSYANDESEVLELLMATHFPECAIRSSEDDIYIDMFDHSQNFSDLACTVFNFSNITWAIKSFGPYKSAGIDKIQPILLQEALCFLVQPLCKLFRLSLSLGHIPQAWRGVRITFIPKPGKASYEEAKSFRPISLASFILKSMERVLEQYIRSKCLSAFPISCNQHAYMKGKSTITAVHKLSATIEKAFESKQFCLTAFLDVEGAFDNTSYEVIQRALQTHCVHPEIISWVISMLKNRVLVADLRGTVTNKVPAKGCPQGGVLSPLLWILVADSLLKQVSDLGFEIIGYADDFVLISKGKFLSTVYDRMHVALRLVENWCLQTGLSVNPTKSNLVLFTKNRNLQGSRELSLFGGNLIESSEVKYLGIVFDSKLNWNKHLEFRIQKAYRIYGQCRRFFGLTWGLKPKYIHWMYIMVIVPYLVYGCAVWWQRGEVGVVRTQLNHLQRMCCLGITGALTSTPTAALEALLDMLPLHILIEKHARAYSYKLALTGSWDTSCNSGHATVLIRQHVEEALLLAPSDYVSKAAIYDKKFNVIIPDRTECRSILSSFESQETLVFYTDGSVSNTRCGAGIYCDQLQLRSHFPLGSLCSVLQAEVYAVLVCIQECVRQLLVEKPICICSDSQAVLQALSASETRSALVLECYRYLNRIAAVVPVTLLWVPSHSGFRGNELADQLAKLGASIDFCGPEPCLPLSESWYRRCNDAWSKQQHVDLWSALSTCRDTKLYIKEPTKNISKFLLNLSKPRLRILVRGLTGHCKFKHHMSKLGYLSDNLCPSCMADYDTPYHLLCLCPSYATERYRLFGDYVLSAAEYKNLNIKEILNFFLSSGREF